MDSSSILGFLIILSTIAVPILFLSMRKKRKEKKTLESLISFVKENNAVLSFYDIWGKTLIGFDNKEHPNIYFIRQQANMETRNIISVSEISDCSFLIKDRTVKDENESFTIIHKIELIISFYKQKQDIILEFYNADHDSLTVSDELQLAKKWTAMIKNSINEIRGKEVKKQTNNPIRPITVNPAV